ncbi:MAG: peptidyl-prolyl cis-trans isomerase [Planctomycetes bacterium]|nr:peptidyl-prolyl cis-trans isomerase [Planctomycetota bacterium]
MPHAICRRIGTFVLGPICLAAAVLMIIGCAEKNSRRAALTDEEIKSHIYAQKPDRPDRLIVCGEPITWEDILGSLPEDSAAQPPLKEGFEKAAQESSLLRFLEEQRPVVYQRLVNRISSIVLAKRARLELGTKVEEAKLDEYAEQELHRFIVEEHGGNGAEADEALVKAGMNRATYKQWKRMEGLADYLVKSKYPRNRPVTYGELLAWYNEIKEEKYARPGVLQLRVIDVQVDRVDLREPTEDRVVRARQVAQELRQKIDAGADFGAVAKENQRYTDDPRAPQGGLWKPRDPNSLAAPFDVLARQAQNMKKGEVAGPLQAPGRFFLMKVEGKQERSYKPLSEVQEEVRKDIMDRRFKQVLEELNAEVRRQVALADVDRFVDFCLRRFYQQVRERPSAP